MRQTIFGLAAAAVLMMTAGAAPAMACGGGLFQSSCSPCGYVDPCAAPVYVAPVYSGCNTGCGGWGHAALSNAGNWAPEFLPMKRRRCLLTAAMATAMAMAHAATATASVRASATAMGFARASVTARVTATACATAACVSAATDPGSI